MKSIRLNIFLLLLAASQGGLMAQTTSTKAWVIEKDLGTGISAHVYLPTDLGGPYTPLLPVSDGGNVYKLYAKGTAWDTNEYLLDTKIIKAYSPAASFTIETGDPTYFRGDPKTPNFVVRTRVDEPIKFSVTISGVVTDATAAAAERSVEIEFIGTDYWPDTYSPLGNASGRPEKQPYPLTPVPVVLEGNQKFPFGYDKELYALLDNPANKLDCVGEWKLKVKRYAADGIPATYIAEPKIEVWPVAEAKFTGVTDNQVFIDAIPELVFTYSDLYPDSKTYVQIYSGPWVKGTQGTIIETTERKYGKYYNPGLTDHPTVPQNASIGVTGLSSYTPKDGIYTMEIITETPFHNRRQDTLKKVTFEVDRVISSRGKLSTAEGSP
ncbi:hypothetical protein [Roseimicrobium sp. ORNL1]|uniref:hypothetical protein n=1 Tax=Roseimicrobium sp. ORNL1 TaxID=2711231 RepID=UPI0013E157FC|nr:hypothetical protein [Roseimicrobium sp. ORNL1]QIF04779.1 hypothetical protein G5S37_25770 [Roseimicrobium sp. ORNL1]